MPVMKHFCRWRHKGTNGSGPYLYASYLEWVLIFKMLKEILIYVQVMMVRILLWFSLLVLVSVSVLSSPTLSLAADLAAHSVDLSFWGQLFKASLA